jgi:hypothetical protein
VNPAQEPLLDVGPRSGPPALGARVRERRDCTVTGEVVEIGTAGQRGYLRVMFVGDVAVELDGSPGRHRVTGPIAYFWQVWELVEP